VVRGGVTLDKLLAVFTMALIVAAVTLFGFGQARLADFSGPDELAAGGGRVAVHAAGRLWVLDRAGSVEASATLAELGLAGNMAELRFLPDGRLLVATFDPFAVAACRLPQWGCRQLRLDAGGDGSRQYSLLPDGRRGGWWLLETWSGRLWRFPAAGGQAERVALEEAPAGANDLALDGAGRLWVADTRGHRLLVLDPVTGKKAAAHPLRGIPGVGALHWPMSLAADGRGRWWVVHWDSLGHAGGIWVHDPAAGGAVPVVLEGQGALPVEVAALDGGTVIVSDQEGFRLWQVDAAGLRARAFGGAAFLAELDALRERRQWWGTVGFGGLAVLLPLALLTGVAAFVLTPRDQRFSAPAGSEPPLAAVARAVPHSGGLYWLRRDARAERLLRWAILVVLLMVVVLLAMMWFVYETLFEMGGAGAEDVGQSFQRLMLLGVVGLGGAVLVMLPATRPLRRRLGVDGSRIHVALPGGARVSADAGTVIYDGGHLLVDGVVVATRTGNGMRLYAEGEIQAHLAPLLARARRVGTLAMLGRRLAAGDGALWSQVVYFAAVAAVIAATGSWRDILSAMPAAG